MAGFIYPFFLLVTHIPCYYFNKCLCNMGGGLLKKDIDPTDGHSIRFSTQAANPMLASMGRTHHTFTLFMAASANIPCVAA